MFTANPNPILIGDRLYFAGPSGYFYTMNLDGSDVERTLVSAGGEMLVRSLFADGTFLVMNYDQTAIYALATTSLTIPAGYTVELENPYAGTEGMNEYLGQVHSHWRREYGDRSKDNPMYTLQKYKDAGYDFVTITEHNELTPYVKDSPLLWIDSGVEDTQGHGGNHVLGVGVHAISEQNTSDQERINNFAGTGGFVSLAHPDSYFYEWPLAKLMEMQNYNAVEVYNSGIGHGGNVIEFPLELFKNHRTRNTAYALDKWDELLKLGRPIWATAGDDFTPGEPGFDGAAVLALSPSKDQNSIMTSLKEGKYYVVQGSKAPRMKVTTSGSMVLVETPEKTKINFIGLNGRVIKQSELVTSAVYTANGSEKYVRVEVENSSGKSWSQPIWVRQSINEKVDFSGLKTINATLFSLTANTSGLLNIRTLRGAEFPPTSPRWGYVSPVYAFEGNLTSPATLSIGYDGNNLPINQTNLSIFTYDVVSQSWQKVPSTVDTGNQTVNATLNHFSLYTLSSDLATDTSPPVVDLVSPDLSETFSGEMVLKINTADDNRAVKATGILDDSIEIFSDSDYTDDFTEAVNFSNYPTGSHILNIKASDAFGNVTSKDYSINITNGIKSLEINIGSYSQDGQCGELNVIGDLRSDLLVDSFYINGGDWRFITEVQLNNSKFDFALPYSSIKDGAMILEVLDTVGNYTTKTLNFACNRAETIIGANNSLNSSSNMPSNLDYENNESPQENKSLGSEADPLEGRFALSPNFSGDYGQNNKNSTSGVLPIISPVVLGVQNSAEPERSVPTGWHCSGGLVLVTLSVLIKILWSQRKSQ